VTFRGRCGGTQRDDDADRAGPDHVEAVAVGDTAGLEIEVSARTGAAAHPARDRRARRRSRRSRPSSACLAATGSRRSIELRIKATPASGLRLIHRQPIPADQRPVAAQDNGPSGAGVASAPCRIDVDLSTTNSPTSVVRRVISSGLGARRGTTWRRFFMRFDINRR